MPNSDRDPIRWANAIVRLAKIHECCQFSINEGNLHVDFFREPCCACCAEPIGRMRWLQKVSRGFESEIADLIWQKLYC